MIFFLKNKKSIIYSKILYAYDMLNMYSKEEVQKRFNSLTKEEQNIISPIEYSNSEKKQKDFYLQKQMFLSYLNTILKYKILSKHIERRIKTENNYRKKILLGDDLNHFKLN